MQRRTILQLAAATLALPRWARGQTQKVYRVGWLNAARAADATTPIYRRIIDEFRARMAERGYVEGKNLVIDIRFGEGDATRFPVVADELIALKPDVLIGVQTASRAMAAKTKTIPIVMLTSIDPVGAGLVKSLARPGTNVTGMVDLYDQLVAKHVELLLEIVPKASRLGLLIDPNWSARQSFEDFAQKAATSKRLGLTVAAAASANEIKQAFDVFEKKRVEILVTSSAATLFAWRSEIMAETRRLRLPVIFGNYQFTDSGGLLSYGGDFLGNLRDAADLIDQIFKGAKPADLPLRQTAKFQLVINLKTAREIGVTIPKSLLFRADRLIE